MPVTHPSRTDPPLNRRTAAALLTLSLASCASAPQDSGEPASVARARPSALVPLPPKARRHVEVQLFAMSLCPYAPKLVRTLGALRESFDLDVRVDWIGSVAANGELGSMRGQPEVEGDLYEVCAAAHAPRWFDVLVCQAEETDREKAALGWAACAEKVGVVASEIDAVTACARGDEGRALLTKSFSAAKNRGVDTSPTIYVDGESYSGPRGPRGFTRTICGNWMVQPQACKEVVSLGVTVLADARCTDCRAGSLRNMLEAKLDGPTIRELDVESAEGAALYARLGPADLPAIIVDAAAKLDLDEAAVFENAKVVEDLRFYSTSDWNPACKAPGGCSLAECAPRLDCRPEEPLTLDLYMMGLCPFAAKGIEAYGELFDDLQKHKVTPKLRVHFIGGGSAEKGFTSMHGPNEVDEDLRDLCVEAHASADDTYLKYLRCRAADFKKDWKTCAGGATGVDAAVVGACAAGDEGKKLLTASFARSAAERVNASPTWIANAKFKFNGVKRPDIEKGFCAHNAVDGCATTSTTTRTSAAPSAGAVR